MAFETRPLPVPSPESRPYWEACHEHRLVMQRCRSCGEYQFFPRIMCRQCLSKNLEWEEVSGRGRVHTFSTVYRAPSRHFEDRCPYTVAIVVLEEGPQMLTEVLADPEAIFLDMPVEVVFEDVTEDITLPKFQPRGG